MKHLKLILALFVASLLSLGCSSSDDETTDHTTVPDAGALADSGWVLFEDANFRDALSVFMSALDADSAHISANTGAGWCNLRLRINVSARTFFHHVLENADSTSTGVADALAGDIAASVLQNDFASAAVSGRAFVHAFQDAYLFPHDLSVSSRDIRILYALACFHTGDYATAEFEVEHLDHSIDLDPQAPTYREELLSVIEMLMG